MRRRPAKPYCSILFEVDGAEEFGPAFNHPSRINDVQLLQHQVVGIFVEEDAVGFQTPLAALGPVLRHYRKRAFGAGAVKSGDRALLVVDQPLNVLDRLHHVDGQPAGRSSAGVFQGLQFTHDPVELLQMADIFPQFVFGQFRVNHEMARLGFPPFRFGRTGRDTCRQQHGGQSQFTH